MILLAALGLLLLTVAEPAAAGAYSQYHSVYGDSLYSNPSYGGGGYGQSSGMLLPPIAWLLQDYDGAVAACPTLISLCVAAACGFVVQHVLGRFLPVVRLTVFYPPTLKAGELWRLWSHVLLHSDLGHLAMNLMHILNSLDLEGVARGSGYPSCYTLGSLHTARVVGITAAYGALVSSVTCFGAMIEGASAVCFGLDGALLAACALQLGAGADPSLQGFLMMRGVYAVLHMGMDLLRGCSSPQGTIGNAAHVAGFIGGFCYVVLALPALGGRPVPTVGCFPGGRWSSHNQECLAFFDPKYAMPVDTARLVAEVVLASGLVLALLNAFVWHRSVHPSADGYSVLVKASHSGGGGALGQTGGDVSDLQAALARSRETFAAEERQRRQ